MLGPINRHLQPMTPAGDEKEAQTCDLQVRAMIHLETNEHAVFVSIVFESERLEIPLTPEAARELAAVIIREADKFGKSEVV